MKNLLLFCLFFLLALTTNTAQNVLPRPDKLMYVNDAANLLQSEEREALAKKLGNYQRQHKAQIIIVIIDNLEGATVEDYAQKLFNTWGIGDKRRNDGVLVLAAMSDRKLRIHTGRGIEKTLTNGLCAKIIASQLTPYFKQGLYYTAFEMATNDIMYKLANKYKAAPSPLIEAEARRVEKATEEKKKLTDSLTPIAETPKTNNTLVLGLIIGGTIAFILLLLLLLVRKNMQAEAIAKAAARAEEEKTRNYDKGGKKQKSPKTKGAKTSSNNTSAATYSDYSDSHTRQNTYYDTNNSYSDSSSSYSDSSSGGSSDGGGASGSW